MRGFRRLHPLTRGIWDGDGSDAYLAVSEMEKFWVLKIFSVSKK